MGEIAHLYPRSKNSTAFLGIWFIYFPLELKVLLCQALLGRTAEGGSPHVFYEILFSSDF
jgi:hypothetical protein